MPASSRVDLNFDRNRNDGTRNVWKFEADDTLALRPIYDRIAHVHTVKETKLSSMMKATEKWNN